MQVILYKILCKFMQLSLLSEQRIKIMKLNLILNKHNWQFYNVYLWSYLSYFIQIEAKVT